MNWIRVKRARVRLRGFAPSVSSRCQARLRAARARRRAPRCRDRRSPAAGRRPTAPSCRAAPLEVPRHRPGWPLRALCLVRSPPPAHSRSQASTSRASRSSAPSSGRRRRACERARAALPSPRRRAGPSPRARRRTTRRPDASPHRWLRRCAASTPPHSAPRSARAGGCARRAAPSPSRRPSRSAPTRRRRRSPACRDAGR